MNDRAPERSAAGACLALLLAASAQILFLTTTVYDAKWQEPQAHWSVPLLGLSLALLAALLKAAGALPYPEDREDGNRRPILWLLAITGLGLVLRVYALDDMPPGFFQDEAVNANDALRLGDDPRWWLWSESISGRPTLFLYLLSVPLRLVGTSYLSLKIVPVALGTATVLLVYFLARELFDRETALWAAFLLAACRWHFHYSRMAWEAICVPFFASAGFLLLLRGWRSTRGPVELGAAAGSILAMGLYTYAGYRAVPAVMLLFLLVGWLVREPIETAPERAPSRGRATAAAALFFALVSYPLVRFAVDNPARFWERLEEVALTNESTPGSSDTDGDDAFRLPPVVHQLGKSLLAFHYRGDALIRHNLTRAPQLDPVTGIALLLGGALAVRHLRRRSAQLLCIWCGTFVVLSSLTKEAPHATRLLGALPALVVLAALGLTASLRATLPMAGRGRTIVVATIAAAILTWNFDAYFRRHANDPRIDPGFNVMARTLCEYARAHPGETITWTEAVDYWVAPQCKFLAKGAFVPLFPLTIDRLLDHPERSFPRPLTIAVGPDIFHASGGRIRRGGNGNPDIPFDVEPQLVRDRWGDLLYFLYRFE